MRIVWSTLWFLDYRIPVFAELNKIPGVEFYLVYNGAVNSKSINNKVKNSLGERAIPLLGEIRLGSDSVSGMANTSYRIPFQPGLIRQIKELKPDVIVSDGFFQWTYAPLLLKAIRGIPHVMCYERTSHTERNAQLVRKIYRKMALRWIDVICCSGKLCGEYVNGLGFKKERITFGHMVADIQGLSEKSNAIQQSDKRFLKKDLELSQIVYLYVGQMNGRKGVINLLRAWSDFTKGIDEKPTLLLIGSGDQDEIIKRMIKDEKLSVKFIGRINYDEIVRYYLIADVFIIPTLEDNWSLVVSEAMACGLPVITSIYNGCWPELVKESNGWVMDPLNHNEFVSTLAESYSKKQNFKSMGEVSKQIVSNFTPKKAAQNIYESCIMAINSIR